MKNSISGLYRLALAALFFLGSLTSSAQTVAPLVGTWNVRGTENNSTKFIAVMTFNAGGTMAEFDTAGTNSSASPAGGESIGLGKWKPTTTGFRFRSENYIYDQNGNLSRLSVGTCDVTIGTGQSTFKGSCTGNLYACSLSQCPGALTFGPAAFDVSGRKF